MRYYSINNGLMTDSYVNLIISEDFKEFFKNTPSGVFNENAVYPLLVKIPGLFFPKITSAIIINFTALFFASYILFHLCFRFSRDSVASLLTVLFFVTNPVILFWSARPMPDILFCFFLLLFFYYSLFKKNTILNIVIFIFMCLTRTEGILIFPLLFFKSNIKKREILITLVSIILLILIFFVFNSGGSVNFRIAYENIREIDLKNNLFLHLNSFFYVFQFPVMIFLGAGLLYYLKFEKQKREILYIFIPIIIYFGMNVFWKYVQFRHYIPFIPFLFILISLFFKYMLKESRKISVYLSFLLIIFVFYTCFDIYKISHYRIENSKNAMKDIYEAGLYLEEQNYPVIACNINDIISFFSVTDNVIFFDDWEKIITQVEYNDIYFILSDFRFSKFPQLDFLEKIKSFETEYKVLYPSVPCEQYENTWNWVIMKGKQVKYSTSVYRLKRKEFLAVFIENALNVKDFALAAFYCDKLFNITQKLDKITLKEIKKIYYMAALTSKSTQSKILFARKALNIDVESEIDENLDYMIDKK